MISRKMFRVLFVAACLLGLAQTAFGAGFGLYEMGARGNALGGAMTAKADDPSAVYFNPAGITQLPGTQVQAGMSMIAPNTRININGQDTKGENNVWLVPNAYATWQAAERVWLGLGVFSRYGLGTELDENWVGRYNNYNAVVQSLSFNPNIAFKLTDALSLAFGLEVMRFELDLRRKVPGGVTPPQSDIDMQLKGDNVGYGFDVALHYKPTDWLAFGATYRSQVEQSVRGRAKFSKGSQSIFPFTAIYNDTNVQGRIVLPESLSVGVVVYPMDKLSIEANAIYTAWSSYNALNVSFSNLGGRSAVSNTTKNWRDVMRYSLGVEYKALPWLDLRVGYVYDEDPVQSKYADYMVPSNNRHIFSFGPGFHVGGFDIDLSYSYLMIQSRTVSAPVTAGVYPSHFHNGDAHIVGLSIGYKF